MLSEKRDNYNKILTIITDRFLKSWITNLHKLDNILSQNNEELIKIGDILAIIKEFLENTTNDLLSIDEENGQEHLIYNIFSKSDIKEALNKQNLLSNIDVTTNYNKDIHPENENPLLVDSVLDLDSNKISFMNFLIKNDNLINNLNKRFMKFELASDNRELWIQLLETNYLMCSPKEVIF